MRRTLPEPAGGLDLADAVAVNLNAMIGAGVFVALGAGADLAGPWLLLALVGGGAVAFATAIAPPSRLMGAAAVRAARFLAWMRLVACGAAAAAAGGMFAAYVAPQASAAVHRGTAAALVAALAALAAGGVTAPLRVQGVFLAVKVAALAFFVGLAVPLVDRANFRHAAPHGGHGLWPAAALMVFAYAGFQRASASARAEVQPPRASGPVSVLIATALYIVVAFAAVGVGGLLFSGRSRGGAEYDAPLLIAAAFTTFPGTARFLLTAGAVVAAVSIVPPIFEDIGVSIRRWLSRPFPRGSAWPAVAAGTAAAALAATVPVPDLIAFSACALLVVFAVTLAAADGHGAGRFFRWLVAACCLLLAGTLPRGAVEAAGAMAVIGLASAALFPLGSSTTGL
jgi:APA family basic amino acid/polyamine antiporter